MEATIFRYLICLAILEGITICLMDVIIAYLYGSLDNNIQMKIPKGFQMSEVTNSKHYSI